MASRKLVSHQQAEQSPVSPRFAEFPEFIMRMKNLTEAEETKIIFQARNVLRKRRRFVTFGMDPA